MPHHKVLKEIAQSSTRSSKSSVNVTYTTPRQTRYPPWETLEYLILSDIFRYASTNYTSHSPPEVDYRWILNTALTCQRFKDPALDLLYETVPTSSVPRLRRYVEAILANPDTLGPKVRRLVSPTADILDPKVVRFELETLVQHLPKLRVVEIGSLRGSIISSVRIPELSPKVLTTLAEAGVKLRQWCWNGGVCWGVAAEWDTRSATDEATKKKVKDEDRGFKWMHTIHEGGRNGDLKELFKPLRGLVLEAFATPEAWLVEQEGDPLIFGEVEGDDADIDQIPDTGKPKKGKRARGSVITDIATIAGAVGQLSYLRDLTVRSCHFANNYFWRQLAGVHNLTRLCMDNLDCCDGEGIESFLTMSGKHLEELEVVHCMYVGISWLTVLETATPKLKRLLFEDVPGMVSDEEMEVLGTPLPTWPATLDSLVLRSLGNMNVDQFERFLTSLADTARGGGFKALRELDVWCILPSLGWRERASSRKRWGDEFAIAFLDRRSDAWKEFLRKKKSEGEKLDKKATSGEGSGFCLKVLFRLDDSRPTGNQLNEDDFLDLQNRSLSSRKPARSRGTTSSSRANRNAKSVSAASSRTKAKAKKPSPRKGAGTKRRRGEASQSFVVGGKRPRYNSDEDEDFKVDRLAYEDEDGDDSSWSYDEN